MSLYRFHFHADGDASPSVRDAECANDGAAVEQAFRELREQPGHTAVEVWTDHQMLTRIERPSDAFLTARSGLHGLG